MIRLPLVVVVLAVALAGCPPPPSAELCTGALCPPIGTGAVPNDVKLSTCNGKTVALVVASGDARLDVLGLPDGAPVQSISLGDGADPFSVAVDNTRLQAVVTLRSLDSLVLVDFCGGTILETPHINDAHQPQPVVFDGTASWFVGFTNVNHAGNGPDDPPSLDPGVLARFDSDGTTLTAGPAVTLPCKDPQGIAVDGDFVWATCTGPLNTEGPDHHEAAQEDGALLKLDHDLHLLAVVDAARLALGTPTIASGTVIVGSVLTPQLFEVPVDVADGGALTPALTFDGPAIDSVFQIVRWDDTHVLATQFSQDALRVLDIGAGAPPNVTLDLTITVAPPGHTFHGLLAADVHPGVREIDGAALLTLSSQLVPLRLHQVAPFGGP